MHRLITAGPRAGFVLLLAVLVGFELLFIAEARAGAAALEAERTLREERAMEALDEALLGALDVAEARLEALETLPLVEEDGLLLIRNGVQYFPRLPGAAGQAQETAKDEAAISRALGPLAPAGEVARLLRGEPLDRLQLAWSPDLSEELKDRATSPTVRLGVLRSVLPHAPAPIVAEDAQNLVLSAWPWLPRKVAARACVEVQRRGDELGLKTERFSAACARGLSATAVDVTAEVKPRVRGEWLVVLREREVRGARVELTSQLAELHQMLLKRGTLEPGEALSALLAPRGERLVGLQLKSPRLEAAHGALRAAMGWKSALLALTAMLGLGVVWLARTAERRRDETLAVQREFIATVSHELRTPLAGIRLLAETLERKLGQETVAKDYPRRLVVAADGLGFLVENILSFNRLESGRWVPRREPFSFNSLEPLLRDDVTLAVDALVEVRCEGLERMAAHQLDAPLIHVLVRNLLRNAWKYGRRQPVQFVVSGEDQAGVAVLRFSDNGPGIPEGERERVFEAFHRLAADGERAGGGSGLGLALARRIAALHGGTLAIAQSSDSGTTFELRLPR
jgi:two-component system, OmpR family, sensor histidine kinase SenX3